MKLTESERDLVTLALDVLMSAVYTRDTMKPRGFDYERKVEYVDGAEVFNFIRRFKFLAAAPPTEDGGA